MSPPFHRRKNRDPERRSDCTEPLVSSEGERHAAGSTGGCRPFPRVPGHRGHSRLGVFAPAARSAGHALQTFPRLAAPRRLVSAHLSLSGGPSLTRWWRQQRSQGAPFLIMAQHLPLEVLRGISCTFLCCPPPPLAQTAPDPTGPAPCSAQPPAQCLTLRGHVCLWAGKASTETSLSQGE